MTPVHDGAARPRVSVVLPLYNAEPFLAEAIASVRQQGWPEIELVAVDDGSTDGSTAEVERLWPGVRLLRQPNRGPAAARNAALHVATGELLAFLDADDAWPDGKLERQVARLTSDPSLGASLGYARLFVDEAKGRRWGEPFFLFLLGGMVARRALFEPGSVGGFDERAHPYNGEDTDWFLRAWEAGTPMEVLPEPTVHYRRRGGSLSSDTEATKRGLAALMRSSLLRRRRADGRVVPLPPCLRLPAAGTVPGGGA